MQELFGVSGLIALAAAHAIFALHHVVEVLAYLSGGR